LAERLPSLQEIALESQSAGLATDPSELHGGLCGWLAGGGRNAPDWIAAVMADESLAPETPGGALSRMRAATAAQFADRDFDLQLLLPDDDASLAQRSGALFAWCRGFLGGFGLAAGRAPPLSDEGRESLGDLARFAAATAQDDGDQEDEEALAEIEEFVRVAVLLLHGDCVLGPRHRQQFN
jgi:uncharacterized protein YgfB (UPF0149 family)